MKSISLISVLSLFLFSCSENVEDIIVKRKDDAKKKFEQFYACYAIAKKVAPITKDEINWETNDANTDYKKSNVYQISLENFKDLSRPLQIPYSGTRRKEHADIAKLFDVDLKSYKQDHQYEDDKKYKYHDLQSEFVIPAIQHFLNSKYLIINRTHTIIEPKQIDNKSFSSGYVNGDALIFDLEKKKLLGGIMFEVQNDEIIKLISKYSDIDANLRADIGLNIIEKIKQKLTLLTPSIKDSHFNL